MTYSGSSASYPSYATRYAFDDQYQKPPYSSTGTSANQHPHPHVPIKVEESADLPPVHGAQHHPFATPQHHKPANLPLFRFGPDPYPSRASPTSPATSFTFMSQQWPGPSSGGGSASSYGQQSQQQYPLDRGHAYLPPLNGHGHGSAMALNDDYDDADGDDLGDLPASGLDGLGMGYGGAGAGAGLGVKNEKTIRRRSSKACDQCRKSKCKCERSSPQEPCRNCVMLGTACTFLGPSRKRGPPKGYIDAIEARLHQTEALIGILLESNDSRARSVLEDLSEDPLVKEIIKRVDNSPYGHKGRTRGADASGSARSRPPPEQRDGDALQSTHPSNEWQDAVVSRLNAAAAARNTLLNSEDSTTDIGEFSLPGEDDTARARLRPILTLSHPHGFSSFADRSSGAPYSATSEKSTNYDDAPVRRQRRRVEGGSSSHAQARSPSTTSLSGRSRSPGAHKASLEASRRRSLGSLVEPGRGRSPVMHDDESYEEGLDGEEGSGEDELAIEVGQLSLNEDEQVRFHGKVSGLHLLGVKEREDGRNEGGLWRFPKARVWPPLPPSAHNQTKSQREFFPLLPDQATQELLLELYFTYVHPVLPIVHKRHFLEDFRSGNMAASADSPYSQDSQVSDVASPVSGSDPAGVRRRRVPTLLLLAMFSIAARYSSTTSSDVPPPQEGSVWTAGESYMEDAKVILDSTYAASRPSTCQALLLLGYREVGIGAMAQAWLYVGMAVRMAQDLGLHKSADQWSSIGRNLFSATELQERRRIWYGCVVMDKYVSAYIGRPVAIFERDFDTALPSAEEADELELWAPHPSTPLLDSAATPRLREVTPVPGYIISCFNESAKLSIVLSMIMQGLYAIRSPCERQAEFSRFEKLLSRWYLELPDHLRFDPASHKKPVPPPHILTLHMQYWCTVLLMRRPFIRHFSDTANRPASSASKDSEIRATSRKNYDLCVQAANHITSIVCVYMDHFSAKRAPAFMCYYVFTAAIMHVATLMTYPSDPQARVALNRCMDVLKRMQVLWPSAWRALELLYGSKPNMPEAEVPKQRSDRPKRSAEHSLDQDDTDDATRLITSDQLYRQQHGFAGVPSSSGASPSQASQAFTMGLHLPAGDSSAYMSSYDRWPTDAALPNFSGTLSTSVLPQQYSTGLVDERMSHSIARNPERQGQRYPQYWSDYSALGQMDTTYGVPVMSDLVSQHPGASHGDQSGMYVHDHYSMFGNLPPGSQQ